MATLRDVRLRPILQEGRGDARITKANDVRVLGDAKEVLRGEIEKKRRKKRPAQSTHVPSLCRLWIQLPPILLRMFSLTS